MGSSDDRKELSLLEELLTRCLLYHLAVNAEDSDQDSIADAHEDLMAAVNCMGGQLADDLGIDPLAPGDQPCEESPAN